MIETMNSDMGDPVSHKVAVNNPLEQFVALAKSCRTPAGFLDLIKVVLETPGVHVFGEFMHMPQIAEVWTGQREWRPHRSRGFLRLSCPFLLSVQQFKSGPHEKYYHSLNLFAYGTYREYIENQDKVLELSPAMKKKLQHLTIVSLAIKSKCIPYSRLLEELYITNVRDLEDLIIEAIYADIIHGKLDQKNSQLEVDYAIGRDIKEEDVKDIVGTLQEWCDSCESVLTVIEEQIRTANAEKTKKLKHKEKIEKEVKQRFHFL